jgi:uncharacterized protein (TIGR00369 family)
MKEFSDDQHCFVCGRDNRSGLHLEFRLDPGRGEAAADVVFPKHLQGWQDTVHGGLLTTVLDESMIKAAAAAGIRCLTAEITVKFKRPAATGAPCLVTGRMLEERGRIVLAESRLCDAGGQVLAQATGKLFKI